MEQTLNTISAEELFGATSSVVEQVDDNVISGVALLGSWYQVATGVAALLFIFILVRYSNPIRLLLASFVGSGSRSDLHIFSAEIRNIEIFTGISGISLISLLVMRLLVMDRAAELLSGVGDISVWMFGGMAFAGLFAVIFAERGMLYLVGLVSEHKRACSNIWHIKILHFSTAMILLTPLIILTLLTEDNIAIITLYGAAAVSLIALILFIKDSFLLFRSQRFSIFHWILYLCALEIFPLSLLLAPIVR